MNHHKLALAAAGTMTALIAVDTVALVATGERTVVTDDSQGSIAAATAMSLAIGVTFASLAAVLVREAPTFAATGRLLRGARRVGVVSLAVLAGGFLLFSPIATATGFDSGTAYEALGLVAVAALTGMTAAALVMGIGSLRHNELGIGGRILALLGPVALATVALALVAPDLASPVYCTVVVLLGYASIGLGVHRGHGVTERVEQASTAG